MSLLLFLLNSLPLVEASPWSNFSLRDVRSQLPSTPTIETRRVSSVILSCFFTLLTCFWCCIRPDIPAPDAGKPRILITKLNIIFWMLISPELVLFWAFRQWYEARNIAKEYRDRGWTTTHGQFLIMGGFMVFKEGRPIQTLCIHRFKTLIRCGAIDFPLITSSDIHNLGRLDPIVAGLTLLQALWFIAQFISRARDGLPATQLEVIVLALVAMSMLMWIFWSSKPLDVRSAIRVEMKVDHVDLQRLVQPPPSIEEDHRRETKLQTHIEGVFIDRFPLDNKPSTSRSVFWWPIRWFYQDVSRLTILSEDVSTIKDHAMSVPLFYSPDTTALLQVAILPAYLIGVVFHGINCLVWIHPSSLGHFPNEDATAAWHIFSLAAASFSALVLFLAVSISFTQICAHVTPIPLVKFFASFIMYLSVCVFMVGILGFFSGRVGIIALSLYCLTDLPTDALQVVRWTTYIPHFG